MALLFLGGMIALYWAASAYATYAADSSYDRLLAGSAASIAETLSITQDQISVDVPYAALDMLAAAPNDKVFYRIASPTGATVTGYGDLPPWRGQLEVLSSDQDVKFFDAPYRGELVRFALLGRQVRIGGRTGWIKVQVGQTRSARSALATQLTLRALVPIALLTILAALVVWFTVGRAVRPLERIGQDLAAREPSDLSPIGETQIPAEVVPLMTAMNQFMERLDANIGLLRTFIANVAHQLRTPLTAMLVQLRLAETGTGSARERAALAARESGERLSRLVNQLLSDAMVMHRAEQRQFALFDLRGVVEQALQVASPSTWDSDVRFTSRVKQAMLSGDEVMIAEAVKNLVHNALTHGDSTDGTIEIRLVKEGNGFSLWITDSGPGIPEEVLRETGSRFNSSRSAHSGAGLGLAIVKQVAESHRGRLTLSNRPGGGLLAEIWLPAA